MIEDHLADIDFRKKEVRQANHVEEFKKWYNELQKYATHHDLDERIQGQLTMLSAVLWHLLSTKDYKKVHETKIIIILF